MGAYGGALNIFMRTGYLDLKEIFAKKCEIHQKIGQNV